MFKIVSGIDDCKIILFQKYETHKELKGRKTFWQHKLKTFYPLFILIAHGT